MEKYLQDKNAGNAGDYLKHLLLLKLLEKVLRTYPGESIAYIESHAGAGRYDLMDIHWKYRHKYRGLICDEDKQWTAFDRLNPLKEKQYFGSFMLAGSLLLENKIQNHKVILYEDNKGVISRIKKCSSVLSPEIKGEHDSKKGESDPNIIKKEMSKLKQEGFGRIVCLIDPFFKEGKKDKIWCDMLTWDEPNCLVLMFDTWNLKHSSHCPEEMLIHYHSIKNPIKYQIRKYAMYGNKQSRNILAT